MRKYLKRFESLGLMERVPCSPYSIQMFLVTKKSEERPKTFSHSDIETKAEIATKTVDNIKIHSIPETYLEDEGFWEDLTDTEYLIDKDPAEPKKNETKAQDEGFVDVNRIFRQPSIYDVLQMRKLRNQDYGLFQAIILSNIFQYDVMPEPKPEIVYPFNRQYSMSAAKVCRVNSVACNLPYLIISTIEIYSVIKPII